MTKSIDDFTDAELAAWSAIVSIAKVTRIDPMSDTFCEKCGGSDLTDLACDQCGHEQGATSA
jgi:hypothetical protein